MTLTNCTVSGNTTGFIGGGLAAFDGTATLTNCTISGNSTTIFGGGGLFNSIGGGTVTLTNCTVSGNSGSEGGGLLIEGTATLANTIVAGNTGGGTPDVNGRVTSLGNNLIGVTNGSSGWVVPDLTDANASPLNLGPLADNGGPTWTMALLPGSPAINAGSNALIPAGITTDQRGVARIIGGIVDIGAFELQKLASTTTATGGTFTYDGAAHAGSGSVNVIGGFISLYYVGSNGTTCSSATAPTNAGTYTVTATYAGDDTTSAAPVPPRRPSTRQPRR